MPEKTTLKQLFHKFIKDSYYRNSFIIFAFAMVGNVLQYLFQIYANRNLSKADYGLMNTLLSLLLISSFVGSIIKNWSTKVFSQIYSLKNHKEIKKTYAYFFKFMLVVLLLLAGVFAILYKPITVAYKSDNLIYYLLIGIILLLEYIKIPFFSFLESFHRFFTRSLALFSFNFFKVVFLAWFIFHSLTLAKVLWAMALADAISLLLFMLFSLPAICRVDMNQEENPAQKADTLNIGFFFKIGFAVLFGVLLQNVDMQIARINLTPEMSGDFATASVLGKIIYWLGVITLPIFFVSINDAFNKRQSYIPAFLKGIAIVLIITCGSLLLFIVAMPPFVNLFNPSYLSAIPMIRYYAISVVPYVLIAFFTNFFISIDRYKVFIPLLVSAVVQTVLLWVFGKSTADIITIRLYTGIAILVFMAVYFIINRNKFYHVQSPDGEEELHKISELISGEE